MKRIILTLILVILCLPIAFANTFVKTDSGIKTEMNSLHIELQFYSPSIVRVLKYPIGDSIKKKSLTVVKIPEKVKISTKETTENLIVSSSEVSVLLNKSTAQISFVRNNNPLIEELAVDFQKFDDAGVQTYTVKQSFQLDNSEAIYGLGQQQDGKLSRRGVNLRMVQDNTEDYIPFFQSVKAYGLFWDNYSPTLFVDNDKETFFQSEVGDLIDYYLMVGENADGVIACMRDLTGQAPMFPLWSFGFWQSRERYKSTDELVGVVKKYRELQVPLDGVIQDWQYWGDNYLWNATEFLNPGFKYADRMVRDVHKLNAHMIISIWNSFGPMTKPYKELDSIGALFHFITWPQSGSGLWPPRMDYPSGVRVYDPYNKQARDIYWKHLKKNIFDLGIDGWWLDSSEPDHHNFKDEDFNEMTALGSFRKVRNAFPLMSVGGISQNQKSLTKDKRVFILTRSAFAGQQRYGANLWSGDVVASWETLAKQITAGLNVSMSAYPYWNSDIGGFFLWNYKDPLNNPDYLELQVRWMQFGVFCGMMRSHGEGYPREIYQFGEKGNPVYDAIEESIHLRYNLLPYIYSTSWQITKNHYSLMRPLVMDFPKDEKVYNLGDEFMFGQSILVCPVTKPLYSKQNENGELLTDFSEIKSREVYLPEGSDWVDFWTNLKYNGGQNINSQAPYNRIPLFVKAGSILPWGPNVQFAMEKRWDELEIRIYEGADAEFVLYEDEMDNYNYEKGAYSTIDFKWDDENKKLTINKRQGEFPAMMSDRKFKLKFINNEIIKDKVVDYTGEKLIVKK